MKKQTFDLTQKKQPKQGRSQATWEAIVTAATQLLIERGYHGLTTNHVAERAGVSIGSVYEYFPGKDAIVAAAASRCIDDFLAFAMATLNHSLALPVHEGVRYAVAAAYRKLLQEKQILRVLLFQVPFTHELESLKNLGTISHQLMTSSNRRAGPNYRVLNSDASIYLLNTLIASTLLQLALMPLPGIDENDVLEALAQKIIEWTAVDAAAV